MYQILLQLVAFAYQTDISRVCAIMCIKQLYRNPSKQIQIAHDLCAPGIARTVVTNKINTHRNANSVMSNVCCSIVELCFEFP